MTTTVAPSSIDRRAVASPMPLLPPVMTAVFPAKRDMITHHLKGAFTIRVQPVGELSVPASPGLFRRVGLGSSEVRSARHRFRSVGCPRHRADQHHAPQFGHCPPRREVARSCRAHVGHTGFTECAVSPGMADGAQCFPMKPPFAGRVHTGYHWRGGSGSPAVAPGPADGYLWTTEQLFGQQQARTTGRAGSHRKTKYPPREAHQRATALIGLASQRLCAATVFIRSAAVKARKIEMRCSLSR
jgi:hypothetical protein